MHDNRLKILDHAGGKVTVAKEPVSQIEKAMVSSNPYERVEVQHAMAVCLNHSIVVGNIAQDSTYIRAGSKKFIENGLAGIVEELSDRSRVGCGRQAANGCRGIE